MGLITQERFVCFDCETTGLDPSEDRIIEIAYALFTLDGVVEQREDLINPGRPISKESQAIHHITDAMVANKPREGDLLGTYLDLIGSHIVVGHGIGFDLKILHASAERCELPSSLDQVRSIDTLRLARLDGGSAFNSLQKLREHFNIADLGAHRAMHDVLTNIALFKHLIRPFKTTEATFKRLEQPILLKRMPLGKHKGRPFGEIPYKYLGWAIHQNFDQDLKYSIRTELNKRKRGNAFEQSNNPFSIL